MPNYSGMFLRGLGGYSAGIRQYQSEAMNMYTGFTVSLHGIALTPGSSQSLISGDGNDESYSNPTRYIGIPGMYQPSAGTANFNASIVSSTPGPELRPANIAVRYLIRSR